MFAVRFGFASPGRDARSQGLKLVDRLLVEQATVLLYSTHAGVFHQRSRASPKILYPCEKASSLSRANR